MDLIFFDKCGPNLDNVRVPDHEPSPFGGQDNLVVRGRQTRYWLRMVNKLPDHFVPPFSHF